MKRLALLLAVMVPLSAFAGLTPEELAAAAERAEKNGSMQQAIEFYLQFLAENPAHVQKQSISYKLALCYDALGKNEETIKYLQDSIAGGPEKAPGKHRVDAHIKLADYYAKAKEYKEAAAVLEAILKEGAGLYEDDAQGLRADYLAMLGQYDEAAVIYGVLRGKPSAKIAKDAAFKTAFVWIKSEKFDLAKAAIEEFIQQYPADPRIPDLFMRLARAHFEKKQFKSALEICQQVSREMKDTVEALEAAFLIGLMYRENGNFDKAVDAFVEVSKLRQAQHHSVVVCEALFEAAQLCRKELKQFEKAADLYMETSILARDVLSERQQAILEQSLFYAAEYSFQQKKWGAAFDLYAQLRKMGSKINVIERMMYCRSMMGGAFSPDFTDEEELKLLEKRIADNPGTLLALQTEIMLLSGRFDAALGKADRARPAWHLAEPYIEKYAVLLKKYPLEVLRQQDLGAQVKLRMATMYLYMDPNDPRRIELSNKGLEYAEQALAEAPKALFRVEALETIGTLANWADKKKRAFDAYQQLYRITGEDPKATSGRREGLDYIKNLFAVADTPDTLDEAVKTMEKIIADLPVPHPEARQARFFLAELYAMKKRFVQAASLYQEFVRLYGPTQNPDGSVSASWKKPASVDADLDQVYEAASRVAQCWATQSGGTSNKLAAYRWIMTHLDHLNPRVPEAAYTILTARVDLTKLAKTEKEKLAKQLWTTIVNPSLDVGSKAFKTSYRFWIGDSRATPYVKSAVLKAARLHGEIGQHKLAGDLYKEYTVLFAPTVTRDNVVVNAMDEQYELAAYASGKEYLLANEPALAVKQFSVFLDELRASKVRVAALMALGHFGTQLGAYPEATDAYAVLLDEYGPRNSPDATGKLIPIPVNKRLRKSGNWNGIRLPTPEKMDFGKARYGLGFLYWKQEDWATCQTVLGPFLDEASLRKTESRADALFMLAQCNLKSNLPTPAMKALEAIVKDHPDYKATEEVYALLARIALDLGSFAVVADMQKRLAERFPNSERKAYLELYAAAAQAQTVGDGSAEAVATLRKLADSGTFEDVKSGAYYHLALIESKKTKPNLVEVMNLLRKSIDSYATPKVLLVAARTACDMRNWQESRELLDRFSREFPKADRMLIDDSLELRRRIVREEVR